MTPACNCGVCRSCRKRARNRAWYLRHREAILLARRKPQPHDRPGVKRTCNCGICRKCRKRHKYIEFYYRNKEFLLKARREGLPTRTTPERVTDEELERRMVDHFKQKGFD